MMTKKDISRQLQDVIKESIKVEFTRWISAINNSNEQFLSIDEAAEFLNLKKSTLYAKVHYKTIPYLKRGSKLYFSKNKLISWIEEGNQEVQNDHTISESIDNLLTLSKPNK